MIWPDNPLKKFPLLPRISQKSEPQVNQISWIYWTFRVNSKTKVKLQKNIVVFIKPTPHVSRCFWNRRVFSFLFEKIRAFQSFSPVHKKTVIRWKSFSSPVLSGCAEELWVEIGWKYSSVLYGACAVWCMTLHRFVVFLSRFFKKKIQSGNCLVPFTRVRTLLTSS